MNVTSGAISDEVARRWVIANLRRLEGDGWSFDHMRLDVTNSGVLGPRGLNGNDKGIIEERTKGTTQIECEHWPVLSAGVVAVPEAHQNGAPWAYLTDFVIVLVYRANGKECHRVLPDGRRETIPRRKAAGELAWQLDTGEFRADPVVGDLWYQAHGWTCPMDGTSSLDELCGLVRPSGYPAEEAGRK